LGQGALAPQIHLLPSQMQKLADRSDVISEVPKCSKIQIFRGSAPDPAGLAYSAPPHPLTDGEGAHNPPSRTPPRSRPLGPCFYRVGHEGADGGNAPQNLWSRTATGRDDLLLRLSPPKSTSGKFVTHTANKLHHATAARAHDARPHCRLMSPF